MRPRVIVDPAFRRMDEIFDPPTLERLHDHSDVVWGRDEPMPERRFLTEIATADAVVFGAWRHGRPALDAGAGLRAVLEVAGGHAHARLDYAECLRRGLLVGSCAPAFADVVAEMALSLALAAVRGVAKADREMRFATEHWLHEGNRDNSTLFGATVGFVGCGGIARRLRQLLAPFEVDVLGYDPPIGEHELRADGITPVSLSEMFERCDMVCVLAAPTPDNRALVSRQLMERLRPAQTLVVISRAHLIDFDAMTDLVLAGRFKVALDVYPIEPLARDHPIRTADSAICVPHIAGALPAALTRIGAFVVDDLERIFAGRPPERLQYLTDEKTTGILQVGQT